MEVIIAKFRNKGLSVRIRKRIKRAGIYAKFGFSVVCVFAVTTILM